VWCVGSSIIKHAFRVARQRPGGIQLGLERKGIQIWWQGYAGLKFLNLKKKVLYLAKINVENFPDFILLHCGGNDIGDPTAPLATLISTMKQDLNRLAELLPTTKFIWSQILPRRSYRFSQNHDAMERARNKFNRSAAVQVLRMGGAYLKHPDLVKNIDRFLIADGVHLNNLGNSVLLNDIQGGLEFFFQGLGSVFPETLSS
jgi:lysophospholipase L1-like esterase